MSSNLCRAEYLWEAAARQGLRSVLFYFVGYPPTSDGVMHVDWFWGPGNYYFELCGAACYLSYIPEGLREVARERRGSLRGKAFLVEFGKAEGWANLPESLSPPLESMIRVAPKAGSGVNYHVLLLDTEGRGYDRCLIAREKDCEKALCVLGPGEWSGWHREVFHVGGSEVEGIVRFKLIELSRDGSRFRLYRSQVYPVRGFTHPPELSEELVSRLGPYINEAVGRMFVLGLVDEQTLLEEFDYQIEWIASAARYLMDERGASIFFLHWHFLDLLQHHVLGMADPAGGSYDPAGKEGGRRLLRLGYQRADRLVGRFMELLDGDTYLVVVSDHGNVPNRKRYSLVRALAERGLVHVERGEDGEERVDWSKSKVFVDLTNVYVNLRGRYAGGVVEPSEYEDVRRQVIDVLRSCRDQDGEYVVLFALRREDAPLVGLWGPHVGNVVFVYSQGFTWGFYSPEPGSVKAGGANHGPQPPTAETEFSSNYATFIIVGPGIKKGYERPVDFLGPVQLVDVAPTISHLLGIRPPRHSQGRVLYDFLEGWDVSEVRRERRPLKFPTTPVELKGDVTDLV